MAEKGIKSVWIDSDSVGVLGTKVYRDDVLIATVPFGTLFYNDDTAVEGVQYKYEVQAYTSTSESTDEVEGVNMDYYTIGVSGLTPIMTEFTVSEEEPNLVYFSTPLGYPDGLTTTGFVVSNATISSVTKVDNNGGYFTLDTSLTYWDNNTIRLGENDNLSDVQTVMHNFTLEWVENYIVQPDALVDKFVAATPSGSADGSSEANAASFATAIDTAVAGETWWCKAGDYGRILETMQRTGDPTSPIKFKGYQNAIGDLDGVANYFNYGVAMDDTKMPTFTGVNVDYDGGNGDIALLWRDCNHIIMENFQVRNYYIGFRGYTTTDPCSNLAFKNCNFEEFGTPDDGISQGSAFVFATKPSTNTEPYYGNERIKVIDCVAVNGDLNNFNIYGDGEGLIQNVKSYSDRKNDDSARTDYHIALGGPNNIITDCYAEYVYTGSSYGSIHGIGIRSGTGYRNRGTNYYNLIQNSEAKNVAESFYFRNKDTSYSVIRNCKGWASPEIDIDSSRHTGGVYIWGGSDYNIVENNKFTHVTYGLGFKSNVEDSPQRAGDYNTIRNNVFYDCRAPLRTSSDSLSETATAIGNNIYNNVFDTGRYLFEAYQSEFINLTFKNNIIRNAPTYYRDDGDGYYLDTDEINWDWNAFSDNGVWGDAISSTLNNNTIDPQFADTVNFVPTNPLIIASPVTNKAWYDANGLERADTTSIGPVLEPSEEIIEP